MDQQAKINSAEAGEDRRRARGAKARATILEHAAAIASVEGLEGLTIGRLATEAGVAKGNIQVLFGDKQALQLAVIDWVGGVYDETIVHPARARKSPLAQLTQMVDGWFDFVETRKLPGGCFMTAVSSEFRARPGAIRDRVAQRRQEKRGRYVRLLGEAKAAGEIAEDVDPDQIAFELLAIQAHANTALTIGDAEDFDRARKTTRRRFADIAAGGREKIPKPPSTRSK